MNTRRRVTIATRIMLIALLVIALPAATETPAERKIAAGRARMLPLLEEAGFKVGNPVFIRLFKQNAELEIWLLADGESTFRKFRTWPICTFSGELGPKTREGDGQAPEGFYEVAKDQLNPFSSYHLSFNLGYPNAYERSQGWTGSYLMVHGDCVSIGCYAMTDDGIEEIYALVAAALAKGQTRVPVHAFPFRFDGPLAAAMDRSPHRVFWSDLKAGFDAFEESKLPPRVRVIDGRYRID